jgi:hypothetical protein
MLAVRDARSHPRRPRLLAFLGQEVEKSRSQEVESRMRQQSRPAAWSVFVNSSTLDFSTLKLKEQTGNVIENKGKVEKVEESRSQEVESRMRE